MDIKKWKQPGYFYVLDINGITKFGIASNWEKRMNDYARFCRRNQFKNNYKLHYREVYEEYWKAEFIESMMRRRLREWTTPNSHEWIRREVPTQNIVDCYFKIKRLLIKTKSFENVKTYHTIGNLRLKLYKLHYLERKELFEAIEIKTSE